jgi:hypothetical protein
VSPANSESLTLDFRMFGWAGRLQGLGGSASLGVNF